MARRDRDETERLARRAGAGDLAAARKLVKLLEEREAANKKPELSEGIRRLFEIEIGNEDVGGISRDGSSSPGGANPATLGTALDSVQQGLEVDDWDMDLLEEELEDLVRSHGDDAELGDLLERAGPPADVQPVTASSAGVGCEFCRDQADGFCSNCGSAHCATHSSQATSVEWDDGETDLVCQRCMVYETYGMTPEWAKTTGKGLRLEMNGGGVLEGLVALGALIGIRQRYERAGALDDYREEEDPTLEWLRDNAAFEVTDVVVDFVTEGHGT